MASIAEEPVVEVPPGSSAEGWQYDANGKPFIPAQGRRGIVRPKRPGESPQEALDRDAQARDERPRRKGSGKTAKKPPAPKKADLRELEALLAEAFRSPAMVGAATGDIWLADHFTNQGPILARNLVLAAEHNPWLRRKLEEAATGGDLMVKVISVAGVAGALFGYAFPPVVYVLNLPVPDRARDMFGIPERRTDANRPPPPHTEPTPA